VGALQGTNTNKQQQEEEEEEEAQRRQPCITVLTSPKA